MSASKIERKREPSNTPALAPERVLTHPNRWLLLIVLGFGFTTWAGFLYIGIRARRRSWLAWAAMYGALLVLSGVLDSPAQASSTATGIGAIALLIAWFGGTAHAEAIKRDVAWRVRPADGRGLEAARQRIERRAEGQRLAAGNPRLAREVGVGRPDIAGSDDFGLIDVNHASQDALGHLPGITAEVARRIVEARERLGSFTSAEELGVSLDLSPDTVDDISEHGVFL